VDFEERILGFFPDREDESSACVGGAYRRVGPLLSVCLRKLKINYCIEAGPFTNDNDAASRPIALGGSADRAAETTSAVLFRLKETPGRR
jgi:hypothetical protein